MQPSSPISSFKFDQDPQSPPVPSILRSRHKTSVQLHTHKVKQFGTHPKEIIIDAHKYNQQYPSNKDKHHNNQQGIRNQIDACLNAVSKVYGEQEKRKNSRTLKEINPNINQPVFSRNSIHRVDVHLILKYIGTINKQYGLQNRLDKLDIISQTRAKPYRQTNRNPQQRFTSIQKTRGQSKRSFINLTVSSKKEKRQADSPSKQRFNATHHAFSTNNSPHRTLLSTTPHHVTTSAGKVRGKIEEQFKYCINCQQPILSSNIDYHETHQCKQLQNIYKLSFNDLKIFINNKINKFTTQIQQKINHLRTIQNQHQQQFPKINLNDQICENVLRSIDHYLRSEPINSLSSYKAFKESLKNEFHQCIGLTQKLNYFQKILFNLSQHIPQSNPLSSQLNKTNPITQFIHNESKEKDECKIVIKGVSHFNPVSD